MPARSGLTGRSRAGAPTRMARRRHRTAPLPRSRPGEYHTCAIRDDAAHRLLGLERLRPGAARTARSSPLSVGYRCSLRHRRSTRRSPVGATTRYGQLTPPSGLYTALSTGGSRAAPSATMRRSSAGAPARRPTRPRYLHGGRRRGGLRLRRRVRWYPRLLGRARVRRPHDAARRDLHVGERGPEPGLRHRDGRQPPSAGVTTPWREDCAAPDWPGRRPRSPSGGGRSRCS